MVITDFNKHRYPNLNKMIRSGGDLNLGALDKSISITLSPTSITAIRMTTKKCFYTVANSNAMNSLSEDVVY